MRSCGTCFGNNLLWTGLVCVSVCEHHTATGMELQCLAKGAPSVFPLPRSSSQGVLGCVSRVINFSCISGMAFGGISMLSLGGVGHIALPTQPRELPLPHLHRGDSFIRRALKYHYFENPPASSLSVYASFAPWLTAWEKLSPTLHFFSSYMGVHELKKKLKTWVGYLVHAAACDTLWLLLCEVVIEIWLHLSPKPKLYRSKMKQRSSSSAKESVSSEQRSSSFDGFLWLSVLLASCHLFLSLALSELGETQTITGILLFVYSHKAERQRWWSSCWMAC